jgi:hypothetical protein
MSPANAERSPLRATGWRDLNAPDAPVGKNRDKKKAGSV